MHNTDRTYKKILDYIRKRKNIYGENDKSSRKAIRTRKKIVNRTYRSKIKSLFNCDSFDHDEINNKILETKHPYWKKYHDKAFVFRLVKRKHVEITNSMLIALKRLKKLHGK